MEGNAFDYERSDVANRLVVWLAAGLATFVAIVPLVLPLVFPQSLRHVTPPSRPAVASDAPALEVTPSQDLRKLRQGAAEDATSYGWIDRSRGIVRIPIARAADIVARRGLPGWPSP